VLIRFFSAACTFRALGSTAATIAVYATGPPLCATSTSTEAIVRTFATAATASGGRELSRSSADRGATAAGATMAGVSLPKSQPVRRLAASIAAPVVRNATPAAVVQGALCASRLSCAANNDCKDLPGLYRDNAVGEPLRTKLMVSAQFSWRAVRRGMEWGRTPPPPDESAAARSAIPPPPPAPHNFTLTIVTPGGTTNV
jgi:hypothetical protein